MEWIIAIWRPVSIPIVKPGFWHLEFFPAAAYTAGMQKIFCSVALAAALAPAAFAQVTAEIVFDQEHFLRSESLPLRVRISNFSGQPIQFGATPDWLTFTVQDRENKPLPRAGNIPLPKPFVVASSKSVSLRADLMPYFNLSEAGQYTVKALLKMPSIETELTTEPKMFNIISGTKTWEREVGLPGTKPPVVRKFALQQATFMNEIRLYARVTDATESQLVRVLPLGMLLSFSQPEPLVDNSSQLHVLFQNGPRSFLYSIITPDGDHIIRQTWDYTTTRPRLHSTDDGRVMISGGARRVLLSDLPPPRVAETNDSNQSK